MKFTVIWRPSAEAQLAELWTRADDRGVVSAAFDEIEVQLGANAEKQGESRWGTTRILIKPPLAVYFDVSERDRLATVWAVWRSK